MVASMSGGATSASATLGPEPVPATHDRNRLVAGSIGNADGNPIDPSPEAIDALLDVWPIFEAFQLTYVSKGLLLEQEKNASALSPTGPSAGASATAKPVRKPARTARRG